MSRSVVNIKDSKFGDHDYHQTLEVCKFVFYIMNGEYYCNELQSYLKFYFPRLHSYIEQGYSKVMFYKNGTYFNAWLDKYGNLIVRYTKQKSQSAAVP